MASEYLKWKYRDVKPDKELVLTPEEKRRNWWAYHKWWVILGAILLLLAADLLIRMLGIGKTKADLSIAYVSTVPLPQETKNALEEALQDLLWDMNEDGKVKAEIITYIFSEDAEGGEGSSVDNNALYGAGSKVRLMGDLETGECFLFILQDPETFQMSYEILSEDDHGLEAFPFSDVPYLAAQDLGTYQESVLGEEMQGSSNDFLSDLYITRRCDLGERSPIDEEEAARFWTLLTEGAVR